MTSFLVASIASHSSLGIPSFLSSSFAISSGVGFSPNGGINLSTTADLSPISPIPTTWRFPITIINTSGISTFVEMKSDFGCFIFDLYRNKLTIFFYPQSFLFPRYLYFIWLV